MIFGLFQRSSKKDFPHHIYTAIVEQARNPAFYTRYGVPDTIDGRFEMIVLHLFIYFSRIDGSDAALRALRQDVFDVFTSDMDRSLREMGVGDLSVPKKMKVVAESFYGRMKAYEAALKDGNGAFIETMERNVFPEMPDREEHARLLASYAKEGIVLWKTVDDHALLQGRVAFPDPETVQAA